MKNKNSKQYNTNSGHTHKHTKTDNYLTRAMSLYVLTGIVWFSWVKTFMTSTSSHPSKSRQLHFIVDSKKICIPYPTEPPSKTIVNLNNLKYFITYWLKRTLLITPKVQEQVDSNITDVENHVVYIPMHYLGVQ